MSLLAVYGLACLDALLAGYRAAEGRSALLDRRRFYLGAVLRGLAWGQGVLVLAALASAAAVLAADDRAELLGAADAFCRGALLVYLPYAIAIVGAFAFRAIPSVDIRSITSVIVFGPLTFARPAVALGGLIAGALASPEPRILALATALVCAMLAVELLVGRDLERARPRPW